MTYRILLAEDEEHLQDALKLNLEAEGYEVVAVSNGADAIRAFKEQRFNLAVLDIMLPEVDGLQVCEQIRLEDVEMPVLFLTAKDSTQDKIQGLKKGADDYITKPFNLEEFLLRVRVLLKHSVKGADKPDSPLVSYKFGGNEIDFITYKAICQSGEINLTKKEIKLLKLLISRKNEVVSREHILRTVWGYDVYPSTRTIDNFILAFRKHFEKDQRNPQYFHSVRGVGYKFTDNPE
ncbi:DNA-binding response regulator [Sphingobacteriales bacterium UPWRP_1]|nr:DNA-binding response regulator [Sphingobacteriales bacterium TSM_CSM]PSJ76771.1 DNA-binding response regulator [Sphingobacteriales bacterium UPWRP_1]